jgi:ficolin
MNWIVLILLFASTTINASLRCKRWQSSCQNLEKHCSGNGTLSNQTNVSSTSNETSYKDRVWRDCCQLKNLAPEAESGIYKLYAGEFGNSFGYCDNHDNDGGWTVILRRLNDTFQFNRNWEEYQNGFGTLDSNFWLGLDRMSYLTNKYEMELHITLKTKENGIYTASYSTFRISGALDNYKLEVQGYHGNDHKDVDVLSHFSGREFSTFDRNNNIGDAAYSCAESFKGGWWYIAKSCNPLNGFVGTIDNFLWFYENRLYLNEAVMKFRHKNCLSSRT